MKFYKFFMGLAAVGALSLASCSSDEPNPTGPDTPTFTGDQAFMSVRISEQTGGARSRAEGDINQPGKDENAGNNFEDGYKLGESNVKSCDFYFYDANGKFVMTANTLWGDNGQNMPNIELKGKSVVVLDQVKEKGYPKYMVTILNKPSNFTAPLTLEEMNTKLVNIANVETPDGAVKMTADSKDYFTMTTTSYADQKSRVVVDGNKVDLPYYFVNELTEDDFYTSPEAAKESSKAVKVYVERLAAKAAVNINMDPVEGYDNTYSIEISVAGAGNDVEEDDNDYIADYELYVELSGWHFNATPDNSYYMKNIEPLTTEGAWSGNDADGALGFMWNSGDYKRSYWGKSYTYGVGGNYNYFSYNELTNKFWVADAVGQQNAAYTSENTHPADFLNTAANYNKVTSILLKARVYDPNAAEGESSNFVMFNGLLFKGDRFREYALSQVAPTPNIWYKSGVDEKNQPIYTQASDEFEIYNGGTGNSVYVKFEKKDGVEYFSESLDEEGKKVYTTPADDEISRVNAALAAYAGEGFKDGMMYYNIPIRHLREIKKGDDGVLVRTFAKGNLFEGDYGVVRNHYYRININTLNKLGTGVWNPGEDIIPNNPPKDEEYYVGAEIMVLSWRIVDNDVDL